SFEQPRDLGKLICGVFSSVVAGINPSIKLLDVTRNTEQLVNQYSNQIHFSNTDVFGSSFKRTFVIEVSSNCSRTSNFIRVIHLNVLVCVIFNSHIFRLEEGTDIWFGVVPLRGHVYQLGKCVLDETAP